MEYNTILEALNNAKIHALSDSLEEKLAFKADMIPWLSFPEDWEVKPMFPFRGAAVRFLVRKAGDESQHYSIYFDTKDQLGFMNEPYWEVYPIGDDVARWKQGEEQEMLTAIKKDIQRRFEEDNLHHAGGCSKKGST